MASLTPESAPLKDPIISQDDLASRRPRAFRLILRQLSGDVSALAGFLIILVLVLLAILGPTFTVSPTKIGMQRIVHGISQLAPFSPSWQNPFGTDQLGRDIFSRVLYGLRTSLLIGVVVRGLTIVAGSLLGLIAGYVGGLIDTIIMRVVDILYAFPVILLAMAITAILGPGFRTIVLALILVSWPDVARLVRSQTLVLKEAAYVDAARTIGSKTWPILLRHIMPNTIDIIVVTFSIGIPGAIMYEAGLSFFGFGLQPPMPSLGSIIADGRGYITTAWWYPFFPGLVLMLVTVSFNLLGDGLGRALDPRRRS